MNNYQFNADLRELQNLKSIRTVIVHPFIGREQSCSGFVKIKNSIKD
jgi:hypothetical protein